MSGSYFPSYSISYGFEMGGAVTIVFFVLALAAAIALVALFLPRNKRGFYTGFTAKLYDFLNFNSYWLPVIVKATYIFLTVFCILMGFYIMFAASFLIGLVTIVLTPIFLRLIYQAIFLLYSSRERLGRSNALLEQIARNTREKNDGND